MESLKDYTILTAHQAYVILREERKQFLKAGNHQGALHAYHQKRRIKQQTQGSCAFYYLYAGLYVDDDNFVVDPDSLKGQLLKPHVIKDVKELAKQVYTELHNGTFDIMKDYLEYTNSTPKIDAQTLKNYGYKPIVPHFSDKSARQRALKLNRQAKALFNKHFDSIKDANDSEVGFFASTWSSCSHTIHVLNKTDRHVKHNVRVYETLIRDIKKTVGSHPHGLFDVTNAKNAFKSNVHGGREDVRKNEELVKKLSEYPGNVLLIDRKLAKPTDVENNVTAPAGESNLTPEFRAKEELQELQK